MPTEREMQLQDVLVAYLEAKDRGQAPELPAIQMRYPQFAADPTVAEESYEQELNYLRLLQRERSSFLQPFAVAMAQLASRPHWPWGQLLTATDKARIIPIRNFRGPFDAIIVFGAPHQQELKQTLLLWSQAGLPLPMLVYPGQQNLMLTSAAFLVEPSTRTRWHYLLNPGSVRMVRDRMGLNRRPQ